MTNVIDHIKPQVQAATETGFEAAALVLSQIERATKQAIELGKQQHEFAQIQFNSVTTIKDPAQVFQFVQQQIQATGKYAADLTKEVYELNQAFQSELGDFANTHFDAKHKELNQLVIDALKNAPEGSDIVVSVVKQAVDAGNSAVAEARKNAKIATKLVNDTFEQAKAHTTTAKASTRSARTAK